MAGEHGSSGRVVCVVLGAGQGTRMGSSINKVFLTIRGKPVIVYAIEAFERCAAIDEILLVAARGEEEQLCELAAHCNKVCGVIQGGVTRHGSEQCALDVLRPRINAGEVEIVLIHDGARPFVAVDKVEEVVRKAREVGGAILAAPLEHEEFLVRANGEQQVLDYFAGRTIWKAQTPQAFRAALLLDAYDHAASHRFYGTDTASSVERIGGHVAIVESDSTNLKITTAHDLLFAEKLCLMNQQVWGLDDEV